MTASPTQFGTKTAMLIRSQFCAAAPKVLARVAARRRVELSCPQPLQHTRGRESRPQCGEVDTTAVGLHKIRARNLVAAVVRPLDEDVGPEFFDQRQRRRLVKDGDVVDG